MYRTSSGLSRKFTGTRMRPYNGHIPKPLVEIGGKSLIDYSLDRLADAGVESVVVNVHHLADILERHLAPRQRPHIVISDERGELLGTGGGIAKALPKLGDAPFFLANSDTVWLDGVKPNFQRMADAFDPKTMDVLLLLAPTTNSIGYFSDPADIISATANSAKILVYADQTVQNNLLKTTSRLDRSVIEVSMLKQGGRWLIDNLQPF